MAAPIGFWGNGWICLEYEPKRVESFTMDPFGHKYSWNDAKEDEGKKGCFAMHGHSLNLLSALIWNMWLPRTECCDMDKTWLCSPFSCSSLSYYSTLTKWIIVMFVFVSDLQKEFDPNWNDVRTKFINAEQTKTCLKIHSWCQWSCRERNWELDQQWFVKASYTRHICFGHKQQNTQFSLVSPKFLDRLFLSRFRERIF